MGRAKKENAEETALNNENLTLEELFNQIDALMEKLSDDNVPLEDSIKLYKEGMDKLNRAREIIDEVEGKLTELGEENAS